MTKQHKAEILLVFAALIWGFAFSVQRIGAQFLGSFSFNGIRFILGSISLVPLILYRNNEQKKAGVGGDSFRELLKGGFVCGVLVFFGANLQQLGIEQTTAGKAGFITGLYIVLVPLIGIFFGKRFSFVLWVSVILAAVGLYFLSVTEHLTIERGDLLVLIGSLFWAFHILALDHFTKKVDTIKLASLQFATCGILCSITAGFTETISWGAVYSALPTLLYGGFASVGIAYTLQAVAQKHTSPVQAALILSLETVFSAVGGFLILGELMTARMLLGCVLIFAGILLSQL